MKRLKRIIVMLLVLTMLIGCSNTPSTHEEITEEKAKQMIIEEHFKDCCSEPEIVSIDSTEETYVIEWQIPSIYEFGTDSVHKKTGKIRTIQSSRGACEWK